MWETQTIVIPSEVPTLQYKYLVMRGDRVLYWEGFPGNRRLDCALLPKLGTTVVQDAWFCSNVLSRLYAPPQALVSLSLSPLALNVSKTRKPSTTHVSPVRPLPLR